MLSNAAARRVQIFAHMFVRGTVRRAGPVALIASMMTVAACSSGNDGGTGPNGLTGTFKATIDGSAWVATTAAAAASAGGIFTLTGVAANGTAVTMSLYSVDAPGVYPLGVGGTVAGGIATVTATPSLWSTPLSGAAGTVTITAVSPTHITGTFSFNAPPTIGQTVTNTRAVTAGQFDLSVVGPATLVVPDNASSKWSGTMGSTAFNAATIVSVTLPSSGTLTIGASNTSYSLNLILPGYTGVGTYALGGSTLRSLQVSTVGGTSSTVWGGTAATSTGNVVITSATSTKIKGTYSATLAASIINPNAGALTVSGSFEKSVP